MALLIPVVVAFATALGLGGCASTRTIKTSERDSEKLNEDSKDLRTRENYDRCHKIEVQNNARYEYDIAKRCMKYSEMFKFVDNPNFDKCCKLFGSSEKRICGALKECMDLSGRYTFLDNPNFDKCNELCRIDYSSSHCVSKCIDEADEFAYLVERDQESAKENIDKSSTEAESKAVDMKPVEISVSEVLGETHFSTNGFELTEAAKEILDSIAAKMETENELTIEIIGSADGEGEDVNNMKLSNKRALSAYEYLTKEKEVDPKRIKQLVSKGENEALAEVSEESRSITVRAKTRT